MIYPPKPPSPPSVIVEIEQKEKRIEDPFEELGIGKELFSQLALSQRIAWSGEQLDHLQSMLDGEDVPDEIVQELIELYLNPPAVQSKFSPPQSPRKVDRFDMDPEELAEEMAGTTEGLPMSVEPTISYEVPSSRIDLDSWLKNK